MPRNLTIVAMVNLMALRRFKEITVMDNVRLLTIESCEEKVQVRMSRMVAVT